MMRIRNGRIIFAEKRTSPTTIDQKIILLDDCFGKVCNIAYVFKPDEQAIYVGKDYLRKEFEGWKNIRTAVLGKRIEKVM